MSLGSVRGASRDKRVFRFLSYLLVFLMLACAVLTLGILINVTLPEWHTGIMTGLLLVIVVDRLLTYRYLKSLTPFSSEWTFALLAQWLLILVLTRFLLSYARGTEAFLADLTLFTRGDLARLFTGEYVITMLLALPIWILPGQFLDLLDEIGLNPELALNEETAPAQPGAIPAHQRLAGLIFTLGIILVVLTVLTRLNLRTVLSDLTKLPNVEVGRFSGAEAGALLYFVFGLTLLSLSRLMSLQTHWNRLRIPVSSANLVRQWAIYSLVFLLILGVMVGLLPAGDSLGFFALLGTLLSFLLGILFFIGQVILFLISLLFSLPLLLLRGEPVEMDNRPVAPVFPTLPVEPATPPPPSEAWMLFRSILLWVVLAVILVFAFVQFVRQHGGLRATLRNSRVTNWLLLAWQWLYKGVSRTGANLSYAITNGWEGLLSRLEARQALPSTRLFRLRSLAPRQRIYFFYLAMLRRGGEQGLARGESQTPSEYATFLERALPSATEDINSITDAFVEARYSRQEVEAKTADAVKTTWERIRRALQDKAKTNKSAKS